MKYKEWWVIDNADGPLGVSARAPEAFTQAGFKHCQHVIEYSAYEAAVEWLRDALYELSSYRGCKTNVDREAYVKAELAKLGIK